MMRRLFRLLLSGRTSMANFAITNECNASCKHCNFPSVTHGRTVGLDDAKEAIDALSRLGVGLVSFTGGEPFTVPHLPDMVEHATDRGLVVYTGSNGSLTTTDLADRLAQAGVAAIWVSVDAADPSSLEAQRGIPALASSIHHTVNLFEERGVPVFAICALNRSVLDVDRYLAFLGGMGIGSVKFDYPMTQRTGSSYLGFSEDPCLEMSSGERAQMVESILRHKDRGSGVHVVNPKEGLRGFLAHSRGQVGRYCCPAGRHVLYLDWDLRLWRCTQLDECLGDVRSVEASSMDADECHGCYYQGTRDYAPVYYLLEVLGGRAPLDVRVLGGLRAAWELGRSNLI